ncbi:MULTISPECIES: transcriptional regulator CecR [Proteus]|uniref:transcriptional regulator CecR n=1 Tax=Proteus TaxID=583 RepID=UPI000BFCA14A|nr:MULTISPECIES: transcriptional regulator CecR [Proteus]ATN01293.1 transcriptional regulator [Proteus vulgaris]MBG2837319.1 transcriptional regulator CecR [Proteus terrae subsp. cibarius]MBG2869897.1 transcriptional regulator CecR [Proteus terrae subsp. cibarius]MBJ2109189.1 transcriptional regulator CecR [Proteus terrae]MBJ2132906.1 transcriptional regulator CecR [Proteus terrae]
MSDTQQKTTRGELAKRQLLEAACEIFGKNGPDAATTRQIAQAAQQNIAAIAYYFGSKEGLYLAVAQHIADLIRLDFEPTVAILDEFLERPNPTEHLPLLQTLITDSFLQYAQLVLDKANIHLSRIMAREQLVPTEAYSLIHQQALSPLLTRVNKLLAIYIGLDPALPTTMLHTHAILGEVLSFRLVRETILRQTGWDRIGKNEYQVISNTLKTHIALLLNGLREIYTNTHHA